MTIYIPICESVRAVLRRHIIGSRSLTLFPPPLPFYTHNFFVCLVAARILFLRFGQKIMFFCVNSNIFILVVCVMNPVNRELNIAELRRREFFSCEVAHEVQEKGTAESWECKVRRREFFSCEVAHEVQEKGTAESWECKGKIKGRFNSKWIFHRKISKGKFQREYFKVNISKGKFQRNISKGGFQREDFKGKISKGDFKRRFQWNISKGRFQRENFKGRLQREYFKGKISKWNISGEGFQLHFLWMNFFGKSDRREKYYGWGKVSAVMFLIFSKKGLHGEKNWIENKGWCRSRRWRYDERNSVNSVLEAEVSNEAVGHS